MCIRGRFVWSSWGPAHLQASAAMHCGHLRRCLVTPPPLLPSECIAPDFENMFFLYKNSVWDMIVFEKTCLFANCLQQGGMLQYLVSCFSRKCRPQAAATHEFVQKWLMGHGSFGRNVFVCKLFVAGRHASIFCELFPWGNHGPKAETHKEWLLSFTPCQRIVVTCWFGRNMFAIYRFHMWGFEAWGGETSVVRGWTILFSLLQIPILRGQ